MKKRRDQSEIVIRRSCSKNTALRCRRKLTPIYPTEPTLAASPREIALFHGLTQKTAHKPAPLGCGEPSGSRAPCRLKYGPFSDRKQELYLDADPPANKSESFRRNNLERNEWMSKKPNQNRPPTKIPAIDIYHQPFTLATPSVLSSPISFSSPTENTQEEGEVPSHYPPPQSPRSSAPQH